jgi:ABC-type molybdate transport system substrate-binding protein
MKLAIALLSLLTAGIVAAQPVTLEVFAAGSLRGPLTEIASLYGRQTGVEVKLVFNPAGLLRERIEKGERPDIFASAELSHPEKLREQNLAETVTVFVRNSMCAVAAPRLEVTTATLLDRLLDPAVKLAIGQPGPDPMGDYAVEVFNKAANLRAGSGEILKKKAQPLIGGGRQSPRVPEGQSAIPYFLQSGRADVFLVYCSVAKSAVGRDPSLRQIELPRELAVASSYGMTVLRGAKPQAQAFADFVLSDTAQEIFDQYGFARLPKSR